MRSPKRIKPLLKKLEKIWKKHPDLRLGQLIVNSLDESADLFYVEDEDLLRQIEHMYYYGGYGDKTRDFPLPDTKEIDHD